MIQEWPPIWHRQQDLSQLFLSALMMCFWSTGAVLCSLFHSQWRENRIFREKLIPFSSKGVRQTGWVCIKRCSTNRRYLRWQVQISSGGQKISFFGGKNGNCLFLQPPKALYRSLGQHSVWLLSPIPSLVHAVVNTALKPWLALKQVTQRHGDTFPSKSPYPLMGIEKRSGINITMGTPHFLLSYIPNMSYLLGFLVLCPAPMDCSYKHVL